MYLDKAISSSAIGFPIIICILVIHFYEFNIPILVRFWDQRVCYAFGTSFYDLSLYLNF